MGVAPERGPDGPKGPDRVQLLLDPAAVRSMICGLPRKSCRLMIGPRWPLVWSGWVNNWR